MRWRWNHCRASRGLAALVECRGLVPRPLDEVLKLLLQLAHHGLDVSLHSLGELSGQWLHLGPDGPVGGGREADIQLLFVSRKKEKKKRKPG